MAGCIPTGDSGARIRGQIQAHRDQEVVDCQLTLHLARNGVVVGQAKVGKMFNATFVIAPHEDDYYVTITCERLDGRYQSPTLRLGSVDAYRAGIDLGTITISDSDEKQN
jgi:hypothetical protein